MSRSKSALLPRLRRLTRAPSAGDAQPSRRARAGATGAIFALGAVLVSLNVQVAEARPELRARVSSPPDGASATAPPDAAEQSRRVGELVRREQLLAAQLAATEPRPNQLSEGAPESTRVIELSQELRHVRAMERWLETRFVDECAAWDRREAQRAAR